MDTNEPPRRNAPDHVPPHLFWDRDLVEYCCELEDPFVSAARLHDGPDVIWARHVGYGRSGWIPTRYALQEEVFLDPDRFSSVGIMDLREMLGAPIRMTPIEFDPPLHTAYRNVMNSFFAPKVVNSLDADIRRTCNDLISAFEPRGSCEYISEFAIKFPTYIFLAFMGLPRDMAPQFLEWDHTLWRSEDVAVRTHCARSILHYLQGFVDEQRKKKSSGFVRGLIDSTMDGRPFTNDEILGIAYLVYTAGLDTVYSSLGWHMRHLAQDPALQNHLRERPDRIPRAVDEFLRAFCVVAGARHVTRDMDFHGVFMRKGDLICLPTYIAARDPRAFQDPHRIDLDRQGRILAFGTGHHTCIGMHLARREIRIVLQTVLSRLKNIRIPRGDAYRYHSGAAVVGVDYLPLTWDGN